MNGIFCNWLCWNGLGLSLWIIVWFGWCVKCSCVIRKLLFCLLVFILLIWVGVKLVLRIVWRCIRMCGIFLKLFWRYMGDCKWCCCIVLIWMWWLLYFLVKLLFMYLVGLILVCVLVWWNLLVFVLFFGDRVWVKVWFEKLCIVLLYWGCRKLLLVVMKRMWWWWCFIYWWDMWCGGFGWIGKLKLLLWKRGKILFEFVFFF